MFKTNGSTHHEGIANEHHCIALLNDRNYFDCPVTHLGGTKHKADAMAGSIPISIKRKKGLANGSFDWVNTSSINGIVNRKLFASFLSTCSDFRSSDLGNGSSSNSEIIAECRDWFNKCCEAALATITPEQITEFLATHVDAANQGFKIVVADTLEDTLYIIDHERTPLAQLLSKGYKAHVVMGKGKTSAKVIFSAPGKTINDIGSGVDIGLRVRVTSNNGIKAFLGLSKANKNSQIVIKIQQDKVQQFVTDSSPAIVFAD